VGLDRTDWPSSLVRDLVEAEIAEEPERHGLAVRLVETGDGRPDIRGARGPERGHGRIRAAGQIERTIRIGGIDPRDVAPLLCPPERDPDGDPGEPRPDRAIGPPAGEASEPHHERLLGRILGFMEVPQDPVARPDDRRRLALDEDAEGLAIAGEDGVDSAAFIKGLGLVRTIDWIGRATCRRDGTLRDSVDHERGSGGLSMVHGSG
jgi:hypothetical protein